MSYIQEIRKRIGHRLLMVPAAAVLVFDSGGRLLLQQRSDDGTWDVLGGAIEPGETPEEAARREVLEESGLRVEKLELFQVFSGPDFFWTYPNGDQVHLVCVTYVARDGEGDLRCDPDEGLALRYFPLDDLPSPMGTPNRALIEAYLRQVGSPTIPGVRVSG